MEIDDIRAKETELAEVKLVEAIKADTYDWEDVDELLIRAWQSLNPSEQKAVLRDLVTLMY